MSTVITEPTALIGQRVKIITSSIPKNPLGRPGTCVDLGPGENLHTPTRTRTRIVTYRTGILVGFQGHTAYVRSGTRIHTARTSRLRLIETPADNPVAYPEQPVQAMTKAAWSVPKLSESSDPMTIKELLDALQKARSDAEVVFDFCSCVPTVVNSYRGEYSQPAIGWREYDKAPKVSEFIAELNRATDGRKFDGWKGGQFAFGQYHVLYVDQRGECTGTTIFKVSDDGYRVVLHTQGGAA